MIPVWRSRVQGTCSVWGTKLTGDHSSANAHLESLANAQVHVTVVKGDILEQQKKGCRSHIADRGATEVNRRSTV